MVKYSVLWQQGKRFQAPCFVFVFTDEETEVALQGIMGHYTALLEPLH